MIQPLILLGLIREPVRGLENSTGTLVRDLV